VAQGGDPKFKPPVPQKNKKIKKQKHIARCWWLTPMILAPQDAEIRRIWVPRQPQANSSRDPISKTPITKKNWLSGLSGKSTCLASMRL
jgi:hypothetical protein